MASCMLHAKSLPHKLWAKALNCAKYIQNKSPHRSVKDQTPFEAWSDSKPEGYRLLISSTNKLIIERSVKFEECLSHAPQLPHADTLYLPHVRDDDSIHSDANTEHADVKVEHADAKTESSDTNLVHVNDDSHPSPDRASSSESYSPVINKRTRSLREIYAQDHPATRNGLCYAEAFGYPSWESAMEDEYNSLLENQTWDLVPLPSGRKLVRCKWVYSTKSVVDGQITRRKARVVAKGFQQVHGIDYDETFAPVAKMDSICLTLAIAAAQGWEVH
eukprot:PITA_30107